MSEIVFPANPEDQIKENAPLGAYREGFTMMPVTAEANWRGSGSAGVVNTFRSDVLSYQFIVQRSGRYQRFWDGTKWGPWKVEVPKAVE